jgi:RNA polymerase sigma factor (sigma-70 family)
VANSHRRWGTDPWVSEEAIEEPKGLSEVAMDLYVDNHDQVLRTARATARRYGLSPNLSESIEEKSLQILERCSREYRSGGSASFKTYLLSNITPTLRKECIRLSKRTGRASDSDWENLADNEQGPEDEISNDDLRKTLERLVRDLPPIERTLVQRHIGLEDMPKESIESIAADLGIHPAGARRSWSRALQHLKEALGEQGIEDADVLLSSGLGLVA